MKEQENLKSTVLKLYSAGTKVADIVTQTGVPRSTVYYWIKNGIPKEMSPLNLRDYHFLKQKCECQEKIIAILKSAPCAASGFAHNPRRRGDGALVSPRGWESEKKALAFCKCLFF